MIRVGNRVKYDGRFGTVHSIIPNDGHIVLKMDGSGDNELQIVYASEVKSARGFAAMSKEQQLEFARRGGRAVHAKGKAHKWTSEQAREAGKRGGVAAHAKGGAHEFDRESARVAGSKGGRARAAKEKQ